MDINPHSEVLIIKTQYAILLLVKKAIEDSFYLFTISTINGSVSYDGIKNSSVFQTKRDAITFIQKRYDFSTKDIIVKMALIGIIRFGKYLYILAVKKCTPIARIQNRYTIYQIDQVKFIKVELPFYPPLTAKQNRKISRIVEFPINENHLWCESTDLTTPIFSKSHDNSFVWNTYWKQPFIELGIEDVCINVLQGTAISKILPFPKNNLFLKFSLITLRESANGGTRYNARGIDENNHPGNEVQCELIVESSQGHCWSHVWRRGSVPVEWESVLAKNFPSVSVEISPDPGNRTHFYFDNLHSIFTNNILCINLLHCQIDNSEFPLCKAYCESVSPLKNVKYVEFDWHHEVKTKGVSEAVKELYAYIDNPKYAYDIQFTYCKNSYKSEPINLQYIDQQVDDISNFFFKNEDELPILNSFKDIQTNICRFNCMDSLDRTNVGCFFYCCKMISVILNQLGIIKTHPKGISTYEELMQLIPLSIRRFLCKAFVNIGDCISSMYTNTPACMTEFFFNVAQLDDPTQENIAKPMNDSSIAVKRRYHNFLTDKIRQKVYNLFLGKRLDKMAPNVNCGHTPSIVSMPPLSHFMPPAHVVVDHNMYSKNRLPNPKEIKTEDNFDLSHLLQLAPFSTTVLDSTTFLFELSRFSFVREICIVLIPSEFSPSAVKISFSLTYGLKLPLIPKTALPIVDKPTPIMIKVPPDFSNHIGSLPLRFLFFEFEAGKKISLSNIFVFGEPYKKSDDSFYKFIYQKIDPSIKIYDNDRQLIDLTNSLTLDLPPKITPSDYLKQFQQKKLSFDAIVKYEICRLRNGMSRLESLALAAQNGFNPFDFSINSHRKKSFNPDNSNENVCFVCSRPSTWQCFECLRYFCDGKKSSCAHNHYVEHSNYYDQPVILCDGCFYKFVEHEKYLNALYHEYKQFFNKLNDDEAHSSAFVENWLSSYQNGAEVIFNCDPTYYPSAFFQNPSDSRFNLVLTETGAVTIHSQKQIKESNANEILFSNNTTDADGFAVNFYQSQDLFFFLGKKMHVHGIELRGSNDLDVEILNNDGSIKVHINSTTSQAKNIPTNNTQTTKDRITNSLATTGITPQYDNIPNANKMPKPSNSLTTNNGFNNSTQNPTSTNKIPKPSNSLANNSGLNNSSINPTNTNKIPKPSNSLNNNNGLGNTKGNSSFLEARMKISNFLTNNSSQSYTTSKIPDNSSNPVANSYSNDSLKNTNNQMKYNNNGDVKKTKFGDSYSNNGLNNAESNNLPKNNSLSNQTSSSSFNALKPISSFASENEFEINSSDDNDDTEILIHKLKPNISSNKLISESANNADLSDSDSDKDVPELYDSSIENKLSAEKMAKITMQSLMSVTPNIDPSLTSSHKLFSLNTDMIDTFFTFKIKSGSFSYFHMNATPPPEVLFRRDNINGLKDYHLFPPKPIQVKKNLKFTSFANSNVFSRMKNSFDKNASMLSKFGSKNRIDPNLSATTPDDSSSSLYINSQSLLECQSSTEFLIKKMTFALDLENLTKIHGIVIQGCLGIHAILVYLFDIQDHVKIVPYYLPIFDRSEFVLKFWAPQNVIKIYVQIIDFSLEYLKEPKFYAY